MFTKEIIRKINEYPEFFKSYPQIRENIEDYFRKKYDCKYLPQEFLAFMKIFDGAIIDDVIIYSITSEGKDGLPFLFKTHANEEVVDIFLDNFELGSNDSKVMIFAEDNKRGKFFFLKEKPDNRIFYQSIGNSDSAVIWNSFNDFMLDKINSCILKSKNIL